MGLDITAYRKLTPAPNAAMEDGCPVDWENHFQASASTIGFSEENWPGRAEGVPSGVYAFAEAHRFRAGSYSGYNQWRKWLAVFAGWPNIETAWNEAESGPFFELINFADNEGIIGPVVAAKLAKDFADNQERAETFDPGSDREWWLKQYANWRKAFEMAADAGAVDFH